MFKIKPPARRTYAPEGHVKKITTGIYLIFRGLFFEHNAEIGPRLNIKYGFNWASKKTIYGWTLVRRASPRLPYACVIKGSK